MTTVAKLVFKFMRKVEDRLSINCITVSDFLFAPSTMKLLTVSHHRFYGEARDFVQLKKNAFSKMLKEKL